MATDFYWEYIQEINKEIESFSIQAKRKVSDIFFIGPYNVEKGVQNTLWQKLNNSCERIEYNSKRKSGISKQEAWRTIQEKVFEPLLQKIAVPQLTFTKNAKAHAYYSDATQNFKNRIIFYCKNYRLFCYLKPLMEHISEPILVLSERELPDNIEIEGSVTNIQISDFDNLYFLHNDFLQNNFPNISFYANCLSAITDLFCPKAFILIEGNHIESTIIASISTYKKIPTICIQQGWPGILHTGFRNFNYDYYLTWGKKFNQLWQKYNKHSKFIDLGYLYEVKTVEHVDRGITFFLQAPILLLDEKYFIDILKFILKCAQQYPLLNFYIREHPEYLLSDTIKHQILEYPNITFVSTLSLSEVFQRSKIGVAAFSSTLMEGIAHNTIPFVLNLSSMPNYIPDVQKEGIGIYASSIQDAEEKLTLLLNDHFLTAQILQRMQEVKKEYFSNFHSKTLDRFSRFLKQKRII